MKNWLEKQFRLSEFNTNIKTELLAGLTTFVTMAYVLATIPNILDRKSTRLNSSHTQKSRMPSSA